MQISVAVDATVAAESVTNYFGYTQIKQSWTQLLTPNF